MEHTHDQQGANGINIYERSYLGGGIYHQRGTCKGISVGDTFNSRMCPKTTLTVKEIITLTDDKLGKWNNPEDAINCLYEAKMSDPDFINNPNYSPIAKI